MGGRMITAADVGGSGLGFGSAALTGSGIAALKAAAPTPGVVTTAAPVVAGPVAFLRSPGAGLLVLAAVLIWFDGRLLK